MKDLGMKIDGGLPLAEVPFGHGLNCEDISQLIRFFEMLLELGAPASVLAFAEPQAKMLHKALKHCISSYLEEHHPSANAFCITNTKEAEEQMRQSIGKDKYQNDN